MTMRSAGQKDGELWFEGLKEVSGCSSVFMDRDPWIWDIVLISHVRFLCHTVYFRKEELCHCFGGKWVDFTEFNGGKPGWSALNQAPTGSFPGSEVRMLSASGPLTVA